MVTKFDTKVGANEFWDYTLEYISRGNKQSATGELICILGWDVIGARLNDKNGNFVGRIVDATIDPVSGIKELFLRSRRV